MLLHQVEGPGLNMSTVRAPGELTTVVVTNLTAFSHYSVTITAFTGPLALAASDGKAVGPTGFQTLEEGKFLHPLLNPYLHQHLIGSSEGQTPSLEQTLSNNNLFVGDKNRRSGDSHDHILAQVLTWTH